MSRKISARVQIGFFDNRFELILMLCQKSEISSSQWRQAKLTDLGSTAGNEGQSVQIYQNH